MSDDEIRSKLLAIVKSIKKIIDDEKAKGAIHPENEIFERWKVTTFNYDDTGVHVGKSGTQVTKPTWHSAYINILQLIEKTEEYIHLIDFLKLMPQIKDQQPILMQRFLQRIIPKYLENHTVSESEIDEVINNFIFNLKNKPINAGAAVQLLGIILRPDEVEISHGITLRKPKKEDYEFDDPVYSFKPFFHLTDPTAFLEISIQTKKPQEVQEEITKAITILRLFRPASVKWTTFRMYSDSFMEFFGGTMTSGDTYPALETYILKHEDVNKLKKFWEQISSILPPIFYRFDVGKIDHVSIAFNRYTDALLQNGITERRIANAIMGLEALYFKPSGEQQELIYRLGIRVAKVLGNFSFDPIQVRSALKDAYIIRSIFSHGGHLGYNQKKKFNEKYNGDINNLLINILDFLRVSIIISMFIRLEKDEFIDTIDNALIDQNVNQRLTNNLNQAKNMLE